MLMPECLLASNFALAGSLIDLVDWLTFVSTVKHLAMVYFLKSARRANYSTRSFLGVFLYLLEVGVLE
jgi:hypothetical protein